MNAAMTNFIIGLEKTTISFHIPSSKARKTRARPAREGGVGLGRAGCPRARFAHPLRRRGKFVLCLNLNLTISQPDMPSVRY